VIEIETGQIWKRCNYGYGGTKQVFNLTIQLLLYTEQSGF